MSRDYPPDHEKQNPHSVDRHPRARVEQKRRFIAALNNRDDNKNLQIVKTVFDDAPETAMSAALRDALRRKAVAR